MFQIDLVLFFKKLIPSMLFDTRDWNLVSLEINSIWTQNNLFIINVTCMSSVTAMRAQIWQSLIFLLKPCKHKMLYFATELILVFLSLLSLVETSDICHKPNWNNNNANGKRLPEFPIKIFEKIGPQSCYRECQAHGNCFSVNWDRNQFTCQLIDKKKNQLKPLIDDVNFVYMEMTDTVSINEILNINCRKEEIACIMH